MIPVKSYKQKSSNSIFANKLMKLILKYWATSLNKMPIIWLQSNINARSNDVF